MAGVSSIPSDIAAVAALVIICFLVVLVLRQYLPLRVTPAYLLVPVFLALALPSSIVLLVPIDLASSSGTDTDGARGLWLPERVILVAWRIAYWLTFSLTWLILPLLGDYMDSGWRDPKDRMLYSLRSNARYQLTVLAIGTAGAVYFFLQSGFHATSLKALVMALAYAWGLILAIYLMGHGLVAIPRRLIRDASVSGRLRRLQAQAPRTHDKLDEAIEDLDQIEGQVMNLRSRKSGMKRDLQEWVDELYETSKLPESRLSTRSSAAAPPVVTERYLADLGRKVKRARHKKARFVGEWDALVHQATTLQAVLDASASQRLEFKPMSSSRHSLTSRLTFLTPYTRYLLYAKVIPASRVVLGLFLAVLSVILIWSEVIHPVPVASKLSVVGLTVVHHPDSSRGQIGFAGQLIASLWLLYMCTAALYSVSEVKVWGNRALVRRQTYAESACWYSLQVAKLTIPLSYNFITMMPHNIFTETAFYKFLGKLINLTPLGSGFSEYFPILILLPVLATMFNLYGKVKNIVGFGVLEDESEDDGSGFGTGGWREGRALIARELQGDGAHLGLASANEGLLSGMSTPPIHGGRNGGARSAPKLSTASVRANTAARRAAAAPPDDQDEGDEGDRYFFQDFSERIKNTFDAVERPDWLKDIGEGIKKPKWMINNEGNNSRSSGDDGNGVFGRLFGGNSGGGRGDIRL